MAVGSTAVFQGGVESRHDGRPGAMPVARKACRAVIGLVIGLMVAMGGGLAAGALPLGAQSNTTNPFTDSLLVTVRALAHAVPGPLPTAVGYLSVADDSTPLSDAVTDAPKTRIFQVTPVFQLRYHMGWIMVDAGLSHETNGPSGTYHQDRYDRIQTALRRARLIVITHEHSDHIEGVMRSPYLSDIAPRTMLTEAQVHTLLSKPTSDRERIDSAQARRYIVMDYERVLPIAPGVVLIRTPGHTPGSQVVYVTLASGKELILVGDVAWHQAGIDMQRQKPDTVSRAMGEDRVAIGQELAWLKSAAATGIALAVSHDGSALQALARRGILIEGLDLSAP